MTDIDLSVLSKEELTALRKGVDKAIKSFEDRKRAEALAAMDATAREHGFSVSELTGAKVKTSSPAKYRHPENSSLTWTGRGRQPAWYKEAIENGVDPSSLLIS